MARLFDDASSEYLEVASALVSDVPLTMACWYYTDDDASSMVLMQIQDSTVSNNFHRLSLPGHVAGDPVRAQSRAGGADNADTTTGFSTNTWEHACAVFAAADDRAVYLNGGNKGTNSGTSNDTGFDSFSIGRAGDSSPGAYMSGRVAEAAFWNVALTDAEVAVLAKGYSPLFVRPQNLVAYWPLIRDSDDDIIGGYSLTPVNTPSVESHPPIIYPAPSWTMEAAAVAPGISIPVVMHHLRQQRIA